MTGALAGATVIATRQLGRRPSRLLLDRAGQTWLARAVVEGEGPRPTEESAAPVPPGLVLPLRHEDEWIFPVPGAVSLADLLLGPATVPDDAVLGALRVLLGDVAASWSARTGSSSGGQGRSRLSRVAPVLRGASAPGATECLRRRLDARTLGVLTAWATRLRRERSTLVHGAFSSASIFVSDDRRRAVVATESRVWGDPSHDAGHLLGELVELGRWQPSAFVDATAQQVVAWALDAGADESAVARAAVLRLVLHLMDFLEHVGLVDEVDEYVAVVVDLVARLGDDGRGVRLERLLASALDTGDERV